MLPELQKAAPCYARRHSEATSRKSADGCSESYGGVFVAAFSRRCFRGGHFGEPIVLVLVVLFSVESSDALLLSLDSRLTVLPESVFNSIDPQTLNLLKRERACLLANFIHG